MRYRLADRLLCDRRTVGPWLTEGMIAVQLINRLAALRSAVDQLKTGGKLALVPTMGALHAGHLRLVEAARDAADRVAVSIFVNPAQFGPGEDLDAYPRQLEEDAARLKAAGVDLLWAPSTEEVYAPGFATSVRVDGVSEGLCGASRPGHFDGVALVVAKLFNQVRPDIALFGQKDFQQLAVIRRMAVDLDFPIEIIGVPTVRDADGLALSSRNAYLTAEGRMQAAALPAAMQAAAAALRAGNAPATVLDEAKNSLLQGGFSSIDYLEMRAGDDLRLLDSVQDGARLFVAARIEGTRLIDNIPVAIAA